MMWQDTCTYLQAANAHSKMYMAGTSQLQTFTNTVMAFSRLCIFLEMGHAKDRGQLTTVRTPLVSISDSALWWPNALWDLITGVQLLSDKWLSTITKCIHVTSDRWPAWWLTVTCLNEKDLARCESFFSSNLHKPATLKAQVDVPRKAGRAVVLQTIKKKRKRFLLWWLFSEISWQQRLRLFYDLQDSPNSGTHENSLPVSLTVINGTVW